MNLQTSGKRIVMPEGVRELLDERMNALEKQKAELKPQWVRDWEDSRWQDGSAPQISKTARSLWCCGGRLSEHGPIRGFKTSITEPL